MSLANILVYDEIHILGGKSFMYTMKSRGARIKLFGVVVVATGLQDELSGVGILAKTRDFCLLQTVQTAVMPTQASLPLTPGIFAVGT